MSQEANRPPFPALVDNTMRSDYIFCGQKFKRSFIEKLAPMEPSIHLHAGGAFARGLEVVRRAYYEEEVEASEAMRRGLEALILFYGPVQAPVLRNGDKSLENVIRAYDSYFQQYPLATDKIKPARGPNGKCMIEFSFSLPTEVMHPETGDPILYGGRSDMIGDIGGALFVTDEKTATSLGDQWASNWELDSQITGYIAAAKIHGWNVAGGVFRGVGLLKTKIPHAEVIVSRAPWEIERWWQQLHRDIQRMVRDWKEGYFDYALSKSSCAAYGGCTFSMLCKSPRPEEWIPVHYRTREWNPLAKDMGEKLLDNAKAMENLQPPELDIPDLTIHRK